MDVSVVLCTWNNCRRLEVTLDAISRCAQPAGLRWELVLVANNCSDATTDVAQRFTGRLPLRHVIEHTQGLSRARNTGLEAARGRLIVFTDDDVTPCRDWIRAYWLAYQERPVGYYFGGSLTADYEAGPPEPDVLALAGLPITGLDWGATPRVLAPHERFLGANWACPAEALRAVGPFDHRLGLDPTLGKRRVGEEWDLMHRLREHGYLPWYLPHVNIAHFVPAHKSRLEYTASNWEAAGRYSAQCAMTSTPLFHRRPYLRAYCEDGAPRLAGVPWRTYAGAAGFLLRWLLARAAGGNGYLDYASWRLCRGAVAGFRERRRSPPAPS